MGMSTHVVGIKAPTEQYLKMLAVHDACRAAGIENPDEVGDFFEWTKEPERSGMTVDLPEAREWKGDAAEGYEIDLNAIPEGVTTIRFFNSW